MLSTNLAQLLRDVRAMCASCHRDSSEVRIIPASKTISTDVLNTLPDFGIFELGENRVQELLKKLPSSDSRIKWHFIGQLQTNKVKYIIEHVSMIHSLDRLQLAEEIERQAEKHGIIMPVLVEVNSAGIETHGGVPIESALPFVESLAAYPHLRTDGLMTVLPTNGAEQAAADMERLFQNVKSVCPNVKDLSMGMSEDWAIAVRHGATIIRPGRILFGERTM